MKSDSGINRSLICEILRQEYALPVERLHFLPTGWVAYCYVVFCANGERYFLKLISLQGMKPYAASSPDFYLPLTEELHARQILPHIAYPIPTHRGALSATFAGGQLILFNYIPGREVGFGALSDDILQQVGGLVGVLHHSIAHLRPAHPLQERFALDFEADLLHNLDLLRAASRQKPGIQKLQDLLLPRRGEILQHLRHLKELQARCLALNKPMVICHTDLHGGNFIVDAQGQIHILDWEGALIAPPERDLLSFASDERFWRIFLPVYEQEAGRAWLESAVFGFYAYHRNLEDLTDWVVRVLRYNTDEAQDAEDLNGIQQDCLAGWPYLEETISAIQAILATRS